MFNIRQYTLLALLLTLSIIGCAAPTKRPSAPPSSALVTPDYLQTAKGYERDGNLIEALENYSLAMTLEPQNQEAVEGLKRVETELQTLADKHYQQGLKYHKMGKYDLAKKEFLISLRLWPDHEEAFTILTAKTRIETKRYIVHVIKPGESISKLAQIYYGDTKKFPIIANYNNISDATSVHVGQEIKVPIIEGVLLPEGAEPVKTEEIQTYAEELEERELEEEKPIDQVAIYRDQGIDLYDQRKYEEALFEFDKVLNANPDDELAREYAFKSHFQEAEILFQNEDYLKAKTGFESALKYNTACQQCHGYIEKCENSYKELHYKKGMAFFNEEQLYEAVSEWELVRARDPNYKRVGYLIDKANTIQKKLNELKGQGN